MAFVMAPRHIRARPVGDIRLPINGTKYSIDLNLWTADQLVRAVLLLSFSEEDKDLFQQEIETLFQTAENREAEAIYKTIPLFPHPEIWKFRATEAIRSNVGLILDAMAFNNPYPSLHFDDNAWNQLVLKIIFSDKSIRRITGLADRRNEPLARAISDFAHERWAAGRTLPAEVWFLTELFPGERFWQDTETLLSSEDPANTHAGYLLWKAHKENAPTDFREKHLAALEKAAAADPDWENL